MSCCLHKTHLKLIHGTTFLAFNLSDLTQVSQYMLIMWWKINKCNIQAWEGVEEEEIYLSSRHTLRGTALQQHLLLEPYLPPQWLLLEVLPQVYRGRHRCSQQLEKAPLWQRHYKLFILVTHAAQAKSTKLFLHIFNMHIVNHTTLHISMKMKSHCKCICIYTYGHIWWTKIWTTCPFLF